MTDKAITIHPKFEGVNEEPLWFLVDDHGNALLVGEEKDMRDLLVTVNRWATSNAHGEPLRDADYRLHWHISVPECVLLAQEQYSENVPQRTIRSAISAGYIAAHKGARDWAVDKHSFERWLVNRPKPGPKGKGE